MDLSKIMQMAGEMQKRMANMQGEAESVRVVGEAGGGLVRVVMNGKHEVLELKIDPKTMVPSEVTLVEDLIRAAVNLAALKASEAMKDKMAEAARNMGIDPAMLGSLPGMGT